MTASPPTSSLTPAVARICRPRTSAVTGRPALQRLAAENDVALLKSTVCAGQLERDHHRLVLAGVYGACHGERLALVARDQERPDGCHLALSRFGADVPAFVPL